MAMVALVAINKGDNMSKATAVYRPGDVVRLKSGGPKMTIQAYDNEFSVRCSWFPLEDKEDREPYQQSDDVEPTVFWGHPIECHFVAASLMYARDEVARNANVD